jgi:hypothetical protein
MIMCKESVNLEKFKGRFYSYLFMKITIGRKSKTEPSIVSNIPSLSFLGRIKQKIKPTPLYHVNFIKTAKGNGIKFGTSSLDVSIRGAELIMGYIMDIKNKKLYNLSFSNATDIDRDAETHNFILKTRLHPEAIPPYYFLPVGEYILFNQWFDYDSNKNGYFRDKFVIIPQ